MHLQKYAGYVPCDLRSLFVITSIPKHRHHTTRVPKSPSPERSNDIIFFIYPRLINIVYSSYPDNIVYALSTTGTVHFKG